MFIIRKKNILPIVLFLMFFLISKVSADCASDSAIRLAECQSDYDACTARGDGAICETAVVTCRESDTEDLRDCEESAALAAAAAASPTTTLCTCTSCLDYSGNTTCNQYKNTCGTSDTFCCTVSSACNGCNTSNQCQAYTANSITSNIASTPTSVMGGGSDKVGSVENPIGSGNDNIIIIIANIGRSILGILGAAVVVMFVYGGYNMVFSTGNEERLKKGRSILTWAVVGLVIVLGSYAILEYVFKMFNTAIG